MAVLQRATASVPASPSAPVDESIEFFTEDSLFPPDFLTDPML